MTNSRDEIEAFKSRINMVEYAAGQGYEVDKKESGKASTVMRKGDDKIIVATDQDGHGIYFSVRDDSDNGSIVDFVQKRQGANLGQVRNELRPWLNGPVPSFSYCPKTEAERSKKPEPSSADRQRVLAVWMRVAEQPAGPYLTATRGISPRMLDDPRFKGMIRHTPDGKVLFPHFDHTGLAGYEIRAEPTPEHSGKGFAKGGEKALWHSSNINHAKRLLIVESAIDALSHAQLSKDGETAYISIGGSMSDRQRQLIAKHLDDAHRRGASLCIGTDADPAGDKLAGELQALAPKGSKLERQRPDQGKDWNDKLRLERVEQAKRRQAALELLRKTRHTQIFNSRHVTEQHEFMRLAMEDYWRRLGRTRQKSMIEHAKRCRNADELFNLSRDPVMAGILAAQSDLFDQIEQKLENSSNPSECSVWQDLNGKACQQAQRYSGDPAVDAMAQAAGIDPAEAKQEMDKQKQEDALIKLQAREAQARIVAKAAQGGQPDPADLRAVEAGKNIGMQISSGKSNSLGMGR